MKIDSEISRRETELQGKEAIKSRLQREIFSMQNEIKNPIDFSIERLQNVQLLIVKHKKILEELNIKFMDVNSKISVLNARKDGSLLTKQKVVSLENCPTCFQSVTHEHKDKISKRAQLELEEIDLEIEPKIFEKDTLIKDIEKEKLLIRGYEEDKSVLERDKIRAEHYKSIDTKIKSDSFFLDRVLDEVKEIKKVLEEHKIKSSTFEQTQDEFNKQKKVLEEHNLSVRRLEITYAEKRKELELLKQRIEETSEIILKKEEIRTKVNYLRSLQDWLQEKFLGILTITEKNVLAKLRSDFSRTVNEWFTTLVEDTLSVRLDEDFTPIITNQDYEIDYDFLSGGERTAVALAYRLALNQILNSMMSNLKTKDIIILDEPTDGFSEQQLDKMRDIFEQLKSEQIILVSHEQKIEGFVDNIIKIQKDGTSKIASNSQEKPF
jgi:exonuclease SbcC